MVPWAFHMQVCLLQGPFLSSLISLPAVPFHLQLFTVISFPISYSFKKAEISFIFSGLFVITTSQPELPICSMYTDEAEFAPHKVTIEICLICSK